MQTVPTLAQWVRLFHPAYWTEENAWSSKLSFGFSCGVTKWFAINQQKYCLKLLHSDYFNISNVFLRMCQINCFQLNYYHPLQLCPLGITLQSSNGRSFYFQLILLHLYRWLLLWHFLRLPIVIISIEFFIALILVQTSDAHSNRTNNDHNDRCWWRYSNNRIPRNKIIIFEAIGK